MSGIVISVHCAPHSYAPMIALSVAHLVPGKGIEGDRYYTHPKRPQPGTKTPFEVTLVEQEALEALSALQPGMVTEASGRRNIVVRSCSLPTLANRLFRIGKDGREDRSWFFAHFLSKTARLLFARHAHCCG